MQLALAVAVAIAAGMAVALLSGGSAGGGDYAGLSAQNLPVRLSVASDGRTLSLDISWKDSCAGAVRTRRTAIAIGGDGRFDWHGAHAQDIPGGDGDQDRQRFHLRGHREGDGALVGTWRADRSFYNGESYRIDERCTTGDLAFRARRRGKLRLPPARRDAAGNLVVSLDGEPGAVAIGLGRTWVLGESGLPGEVGSDPRRPQITAVDPRTGRLGARLAPGSVSEFTERAFAIGEGAAWVVNNGSPFSLTRIDARTRRARHGPRATFSGPVVTGIAVGAGGVWLPDASAGKVRRVDPVSARIARAVSMPIDPRARARSGCGTAPAATRLVTIAGGAVWVVADTPQCRRPAARPANFHELARIDPHSNRATRITTLRRDYDHLVVAGDAVWATTCADPGPLLPTCRRPQLHRIGPPDGRPSAVVALPAGAVAGLAISRTGVWISERLGATGDSAGGEGRGALLRVDRATAARTTALRLEGPPSDVAVGAGAVWVIDTLARTLIGVRP